VIFNAAFVRLLNMSVNWQRANIQAAAGYLRERMVSGANDPKTKAIYEGLLEVLEPARRATRLQREAASAARAAVTIKAARERRASSDRRMQHLDRRRLNVGSPTGVERRTGTDRRSGSERRGR
jgi:hypothetical protein